MQLTQKHTQIELQSLTEQLKELILSQLTMRRNKCMVQNVRNRPIMIMSDKTIFNFLEKRLTIINNAVYFKGEAYYQTELWPTQTEDQRKKIVKYVIERNTVR